MKHPASFASGKMRTIVGTEGGRERVILCVYRWGFYLSVKAQGRRLRLCSYRRSPLDGWSRSRFEITKIRSWGS